jgi:CheY-like chemotaxis protein
MENVSTQALDVAEKFQPHLILLDVNMPGMDGGQLASRIHKSRRLRTVPIVFLTGSVTKEEISARRGLIGGLPFLAKPVDQVEMLDCLRKYLAPNATPIEQGSRQLLVS